MKIFPKSSDDWSSFIFVPLRAYVVLAFLTEFLLYTYSPRHVGSPPDWTLEISFSYVACFFVFILGGISRLADHKPAAAFQHFIFAGIAVLAAIYSGRFLASA